MLALTADDYNAQLRRVALIDVAVLLCLLAGAIAHVLMLSSRQSDLPVGRKQGRQNLR